MYDFTYVYVRCHVIVNNTDENSADIVTVEWKGNNKKISLLCKFIQLIIAHYRLVIVICKTEISLHLRGYVSKVQYSISLHSLGLTQYRSSFSLAGLTYIQDRPRLFNIHLFLFNGFCSFNFRCGFSFQFTLQYFSVHVKQPFLFFSCVYNYK